MANSLRANKISCKNTQRAGVLHGLPKASGRKSQLLTVRHIRTSSTAALYKIHNTGISRRSLMKRTQRGFMGLYTKQCRCRPTHRNNRTTTPNMRGRCNGELHKQTKKLIFDKQI